MSKVICDVCGTTYPDTAAQCPICNSANKAQNQTAAGGEGGENIAAGYEHTRGGRFSKQNVKKRARPGAEPKRRDSNHSEEEPSSTGLIVVVILLLIAIISVLIYIGVHYFRSSTDLPDDTKGNSVHQTDGDPTPSGTEDDGQIPCTQIKLSGAIVELFAANDTHTLVVQLEPLDTTDKLTFTTSDPSVATVSADGIITAVGGGEAIITAQCGNASANCTVKCSFGQATEPKPTEPKIELKMEWRTPYTDKTTGYADTTLKNYGTQWKAYKDSINVNPAEVEWTSDNPAVCTIEKGIVTVVGNGTTKIHAKYGDVIYTCIVRCKVENAPTEPKPTEPEVTEPADPNAPTDPNATEPAPTEPAVYTISKTDVTLWTEGTALEKAFTLLLEDANGKTVDVVWTCTNACVTIEGNKITAVAAGTCEVKTTHDGKVHTCVIRVYQGAPNAQ